MPGAPCESLVDKRGNSVETKAIPVENHPKSGPLRRLACGQFGETVDRVVADLATLPG